MEAFKRMKLAGHAQDLAVCTTLLEGLRQLGDKDKMIDFWLDMRLHGVEPDALVSGEGRQMKGPGLDQGWV